MNFVTKWSWRAVEPGTVLLFGGLIAANVAAWAWAVPVAALVMAVAGINILVFYGTTALPEMKKLAPGADASTRIKIIAGVSLAMWIGVLICGRMLTWFRPPFFH